MPIFVGVRWWGGVKWECGHRKCEFSLLTFSVDRISPIFLNEVPHWLYISKFSRLRMVSRRQRGSCYLCVCVCEQMADPLRRPIQALWSSNLTCMFLETVRTWALKNFQKGEWPVKWPPKIHLALSAFQFVVCYHDSWWIKLNIQNFVAYFLLTFYLLTYLLLSWIV